jgi:hypothetical protein
MRERGRGAILITALIAGVFVLGPYTEFVRARNPTAGAVAAEPPWHLHLGGMIPAFALACGLGAASGRLRRPNGPMLAGVAAGATVAAAALAARVVSLPAYPRFVAAVLILLAPLIAEDGTDVTPPWARLATAAMAAFASVSILTLESGTAVGASLTTGFCVALAVGIALVGYERFARRPLLGQLLLLTLVYGILRFPWEFVAVSVPGDIPAFFTLIDAAVLTAVLFAAAWVHPSRHRRHLARA